ncbi:larval cuticle protein LCP-17-like [Pectinophora gossypiella]|uniref:larval cuticle protein LCP-17-like n=1 Tax=Pectinophora gossypiella TaxID=13191 RepID=UPI00214F0D03|nr:larval cuticle protein LCP-17-like [Pectinophora gossypiella]
MKFLILALCVACAAADVSHIVKSSSGPDKDAKILKQELDVGLEGQYQWAIETDNGIAAHEHGQLNNPNSENAAQSAAGEAQWTSPEGEVVHLAYTADENGYQPQGSHLPTPPPIPEAILRALKYIQEHPPKPEQD